MGFSGNEIKNSEEFKEAKKILNQKEREQNEANQKSQEIQKRLDEQQEEEKTIKDELNKNIIPLLINNTVRRVSKLTFKETKKTSSLTNYKISGLRLFNDGPDAVAEINNLIMNETRNDVITIKKIDKNITTKDIVLKKLNSVKELTKKILEDSQIKQLIEDIKLDKNNQTADKKKQYITKLILELTQFKEKCSYCDQTIMNEIEGITAKYKTTDEDNEETKTIKDAIDEKTKMTEEEIKETISFYVQYNVLNKFIFSEMKHETMIAILIDAVIRNKQEHKTYNSEREFINKHINEKEQESEESLSKTLSTFFNIKNDENSFTIRSYLTSFFASKIYCIEKKIIADDKIEKDIKNQKEKLINKVIKRKSDDNTASKIKLKIDIKIDEIFAKCSIRAFERQIEKRDITFVQTIKTYYKELLKDAEEASNIAKSAAKEASNALDSAETVITDIREKLTKLDSVDDKKELEKEIEEKLEIIEVFLKQAETEINTVDEKHDAAQKKLTAREDLIKGIKSIKSIDNRPKISEVPEITKRTEKAKKELNRLQIKLNKKIQDKESIKEQINK